jgi:Ca2+-binding RTX toxin-like protein
MIASKRRRLVPATLAVLALALPCVALAATITVNGTAGDDLVSIRVQGQDSARVALNGAQVASASSGDTIDLTTGRGNDTMIFDEVEDFEPNITVNSRLGRGDDAAVISGVSDTAGQTSAVQGTSLFVDLGSGDDYWGLHNYGDTNRLRVDGGAGDDRLRMSNQAERNRVGAEVFSVVAGSGNDSVTVTRSGFVDSRYNDAIRLGSGHDRLSWVSINQTGDLAVRADSGNDRVTVRIDGGPVEDIRGGDGADRLASAGSGSASLSGNEGNDTLEGLARNDRLIGGPGNDTFRTRDGNADLVRCGDGNDAVRADRSDTVSSDCERVRRS